MTQRVIELTDFGAAENMKLREADIPTPGPGQIVVKNNAIGLNYLDTYFRTGLYPWPNQEKIKVPGFKKAIVTLKKGQNIDLTTGI